MQPMPGTRRWRASHMFIVAVVLAGGVYWMVQTVRRGAFSLDPASAARVVRSSPADGERNVPVESRMIAWLSPGHVVDPKTLDAETVRVYRADDRKLIPGLMIASPMGDEITFTPAASLSPGTRHFFELIGVQTSDGHEVIPFIVQFTTAIAATD